MSNALKNVAALRPMIPADGFGYIDVSGVTDATAILVKAYTEAQSQGCGDILLPKGKVKISAEFDFSFANAGFAGYGSDGSHNTGTQGAEAGTQLIWGGADGATMVRFLSPDGATNHKLTGGGCSGIYFDSGATVNGTGAAYGIRTTSRDQGTYDHLFFREFQTKGILIDTTPALFDPRDPQHNRFINCWSRNSVNQNGGLVALVGDTTEIVGAGSGGTFVLANVSLNHFENCGAVFLNGVAYELSNADHNFFINNRANRIGGGTGQGIVFNGANVRDTTHTLGTESSDAAFVARKNVFIGFSGGSENIARGTSTFTYPSFKNIFLMMDDSNGTPYPTIETGALCYVSMRTNGIHYYNNTVAPVFANAASLAGAENMALAARARVTTESARIENRSSDGLRLARPAADNLSIEAEWAYAVDASGNMTFVRVTGTGEILLPQRTQVAKGIAFPATQVTDADPNTLDDYEEGAFTPVYSFATPGDLAVTYSTQSGRYTKIGNRVFFDISLVMTNATYTTASGNFRITGLPFTVNASGIATATVRALTNSSVTWPASSTMVNGFLAAGGTRIEFQSFGSGGTLTTWTVSNMLSIAGNRTVNVSGHYDV